MGSIWLAAAGGLLAATPNVAQTTYKKNYHRIQHLSRSKILRPIKSLMSLVIRASAVVQPVTGGGQDLARQDNYKTVGQQRKKSCQSYLSETAQLQCLRDVLRTFIGQPEDPTLVASITSNGYKSIASSNRTRDF